MALLQTVFLAVVPLGGQRTARRNAWAGMSEGATRARARREADAAVRLVADRRVRSAL